MLGKCEKSLMGFSDDFQKLNSIKTTSDICLAVADSRMSITLNVKHLQLGLNVKGYCWIVPREVLNSHEKKLTCVQSLSTSKLIQAAI